MSFFGLLKNRNGLNANGPAQLEPPANRGGLSNPYGGLGQLGAGLQNAPRLPAMSFTDEGFAGQQDLGGLAAMRPEEQARLNRATAPKFFENGGMLDRLGNAAERMRYMKAMGLLDF